VVAAAGVAASVLTSVVPGLLGGGMGLGGIVRSIAHVIATWARIAYGFVRLQVMVAVRGLVSMVSFLRFRMALMVRYAVQLGSAHARVFGRDPKKLVALAVLIRELARG